MIVLALVAALQGPAAGSPGPGPRVHAGHAGQLEITLPRLSGTPVIDGVLDEAEWREASVLSGFSEYTPVDGRPAEDSTEILLWYSADALYVGVRAFEPHGPVRMTLADRDKLANDDHVQLLLDTFHDRRRALVFAVNAVGLQADGIRTEAGSGTRANGGLDEVDLTQDFVFTSRGRLTDQGFEVEIRIPFKSLRYQGSAVQDWGINVVRDVRHSGHLQTWTPARRANASFLAQSGTLRGLQQIRRPPVLDLNPVVTARADGDSGPAGWSYRTPEPELGGNLRWGATASVTLNATINPDFSHVEADAQQIQTDPRTALYFPEKRPFFTDGSEQFEVPNQLIYTRRIAAPLAALKLNGKHGRVSLGVLSALDDRSLSRDGTRRPVFNILRLRRDLGEHSTVGMVYTDRIEGADFNRVAGADARLVFARAYTLSLQMARSFSRVSATGSEGTLWDIGFDRSGRHVGWTTRLAGIHPDFRTGSGFVGRPGIVSASLVPRLTRPGKPGARLESWTGTLMLTANWGYHDFSRLASPVDRRFHIHSDWAIKGGWAVSSHLHVESFGYDAQLYRDYAIERTLPLGGLDTVPYSGTPRTRNAAFYTSFTTRQFSGLSANLSFTIGRDQNFFEWAPATIVFATATATWRPTERARVDLRYPLNRYARPSDGSVVGRRDVPRVKVEYQFSRAIFVRGVAQYDASYRDALRDDSRSGFPLLIRNPATGVYVRTAARTTNDFRVDWLFSYQPGPGTVVFAGYGSSLTEPESFRFRELERRRDGFFVKLSYLFRR